jgi:hypothetical protein
MTKRLVRLDLLPELFAIVQLEPSAPIPAWATGEFVSATRTPNELSIVCPQGSVPAGVRAERGFRCLRVAGPLAFELVGILESIARPLASAGISIFAVSTYNTDYLLVPAAGCEGAVEALTDAGHSVRRLGR